MKKNNIIFDDSITDIKELGKQLQAYFRAKDYYMVEKLYRKIISINPNDLPARSIYMHALINQGKFSEEEEIYNEIMSINPNDLHARAIHMESLGLQGRFDEEQVIYNEAIALSPNNIYIKAAHEKVTNAKEKLNSQKGNSTQQTNKKHTASKPEKKSENTVNLLTEAR